MEKTLTIPEKLISRLMLYLVFSVLLSTNLRAQQQPDKPNIIIIYADDMGWGDVGYHGVENDIRTPNIDQLASEGVAFSQGYVSASVCSPSRAGLLTGQYQQRFGCGENPCGSGYPENEKALKSGLPDTIPILPELLKTQGYTTGMIGKWHLGLSENKRPNARGFDYFYGFLNGAHSYYEADIHFGKKKGKWPIFRNNQIVEYDGYMTEVFTKEAGQFITQQKENPFFLYLAYNAVHHPWEVPDAYLNRLDHIKTPYRKKFAGMVLAMDDGIGQIIQTLKDQKLYDNTIIIFMSDNGSPSGQGKDAAEGDYMSSTGGLRGWKGDTYEGGIKVPFIMRWPGQLRTNVTYDKPVINLDITPTLTHFLDIDEPAPGFYDGKDLLPFLNGKTNDRPHEELFWRRDEDYAIRIGDWKLTCNNRGNKATNGVELFNLKEDPFEKNNLAHQYPEKVIKMQQQFDQWDHNLPASICWGAPKNRNTHLEK